MNVSEVQRQRDTQRHTYLYDEQGILQVSSGLAQLADLQSAPESPFCDVYVRQAHIVESLYEIPRAEPTAQELCEGPVGREVSE